MTFGLEDSACLWIHPSYERVAGTNWGGGLTGRLEMREASCCHACIRSGCSCTSGLGRVLWDMSGGVAWEVTVRIPLVCALLVTSHIT